MLVGQIMGHSRGPRTLASKGIPHGIHLEYMGGILIQEKPWEATLILVNHLLNINRYGWI
jgi:hypothetical protein